MKLIKIFLLFLILNKSTSSNAQSIDSLLFKLSIAKEDTAKVRLLNKIGTYYKSNKFDSAMHYFNTSKKLCELLDYKQGIVSYYLNVTSVYTESGKYDSALMASKKGLELAEKRDNKKQLAKCYEAVSNCYHYLIK
jgi:tetratricopeptide (TPR) repeat protein